MSKNRKNVTKAGRMIRVAAEAFKRNEQELAKDIFVLAMEEQDLDLAMQQIDEAPAPSEDELKAQMQDAMENGDMAAMEECLQSMKAMKAQQEEEDPADPEAPAEGQEIDPEAPAEGQEVEEEPALPVASLMSLAAKIHKAGHKDLADQITTALFKHLG